MEPQTNKASTKDWLHINVKMSAYIENYMPTVSIYEKPLLSLNFYDALKRISVPFSITPFMNLQLHQEIQSWDVLSDEALMVFERGLD
ncbi:MAG: hypothetical protein NTX88_11930 [Candidatus Atribacteria bacterium]|nr:hypothetical protein [Candidatus Atribacteria bacterium]